MTALTARYRRARSDSTQAVLEGVHALKHALRFGAEITDARTRDPVALQELAEALAADVAPRIVALAEPVASDTFDTLAPRPHATGVIALARRPAVAVAELLDRREPAPVVLLERPTHHGNIGAVVRVAAAAGAAGVLVTGDHDPWHPASIRGGAGLQFALPVTALGSAALDRVIGSDRPVVALDPEGEPLPAGIDRDIGAGEAGRERVLVPPRSVLVFGSERTGVTDALLGRVDHRVAIPMRPGVSSLNLATAVAVALYTLR